MIARTIAVMCVMALGLMGVTTPASAAVSAEQIAAVTYPVGIDVDASGNVFIADGSSGNQGVVVVPAATGTLFGQAVTADVEQLLFPLAAAVGVAISPAGDLYVCTSGGALYVVTQTDKTVFGVSATANTLTQIFASGAMAGGMDFDSSGNLFGGRSGNGGVVVLPTTSGPFFGQSMTPNAINSLSASNLDWTADVAFDSSGNLYITQMFDSARVAGVYVVAVNTGTLYGVSVSANALTALAEYPSFGTRNPCGISIDANDTIYYVSWARNTVFAMPNAARTVLDQNVPADEFTSLTGTRPYANQGVHAISASELITGGRGGTYRLSPVPTFTVTFDANAVDATGTMASQTDSSAAALTLNAFLRTGYTFAGWATTPTGPIAYADGATYPFTSNATLYARWAAPDEEIPILIRVSPADVHQSVSIPADGDCSAVDGPGHNWAGTSNGGWGKSWAQWPNDGMGGFVCNRVLRYSLDTERWFTVM